MYYLIIYKYCIPFLTIQIKNYFISDALIEIFDPLWLSTGANLQHPILAFVRFLVS